MKRLNPTDSRQSRCYGGLFPDLGESRFNIPQGGKVFSVRIESCGIGVQREELAVNESEWEACMKCPDFDDCYKLSMAKLAFQSSVRVRFRT